MKSSWNLLCFIHLNREAKDCNDESTLYLQYTQFVTVVFITLKIALNKYEKIQVFSIT